MKRLPKLLAVSVVVTAIFFGNKLKAQTNTASPWRLGFGVEGGLPTGFERQESDFMLGGTARLQYNLNHKLSLTFTTGLYDFFGRSYTNPAPDSLGGPYKGTIASSRLVPVKLGIKAFLVDHLYAGAEAGAAFNVAGSKDIYLILSPALGYADKSWDVSARYENFGDNGRSDFGVVALRIAYGFRL